LVRRKAERVEEPLLRRKAERFSCEPVVAFGCERDLGVHVMGRGLLLWLLGIPLPIILLIWLFGGLHG
jgi:hypothetical protein